MKDGALILSLSEVVAIRSGHPFRGPVQSVDGGSVSVVQMKDLHAGNQIDWSATVRTELSGRKEPDWLKQGDLLFVSRGSRYHAVYVDQPTPRAVCGPHLFHLTVRDPGLVLPAFLAWQIGQQPVQRQLQQAASGSNQLSVAKTSLETLVITVPPMGTQRLLVDIAEAALREKTVLTALIRNREQELDALANALASGHSLNLT